MRVRPLTYLSIFIFPQELALGQLPQPQPQPPFFLLPIIFLMASINNSSNIAEIIIVAAFSPIHLIISIPLFFMPLPVLPLNVF